MFFIVGEGEELFTVFDYTRLIQMIKDHLSLELIAQDITPINIYPFFSPADKRGCVIFDTAENDSYVHIRPLNFPNGNDILLVHFNTN
jgi:hypothetical protein